LTVGAQIAYFVSAPYSPPHQRGVRWNDPATSTTTSCRHQRTMPDRIDRLAGLDMRDLRRV
jgi:dTDP-4-dehydrorhamnose 3,5-epimerase-like enzyme